ncbi:malonyl CoA-acyl carrier protein transacylase-like protein [Dinothrombium tinctorium]|uniref:[acyl-carrier-protein] S-malonyltransferase n=1 Tax=Dinothrombium tinctorium TaxID=1965070 RepID=A0A3S3NZ56_9ACAR|nr:malonyl CoA-acyl carrier protein transacylase-like protein [Dinothrombium tinctorium]RWS03750.1 malonyl CoA-acyl carrier protein transacylase-like protein [Dinothrombium tinctorium]RWS04563.1 malonyl CoA-acyl carrier protein transacylase-like protein [Dinothrombium tinctorium]RWS04703.1 malonyl CoA-acyl carrier protein transacylase-like protein [Dinothrombium tinctorium]
MASILTRRSLVFRSFHVRKNAKRAFCEKKTDETSLEVSANPKKFKELFESAKEKKQSEETSVGEVSRPETRIHSFRPKIDPKTTGVILFPGQGSQYVGMGESLLDSPNVPQLFRVAEQILGYDLLDLCLNGPEETLNQTKYCQPAIFVTSLAAVEKMRTIAPDYIANCVATAGFSIGEFAALVFGGALTYENALKLIKIRAEGMQYASDLVPSGMMTVIFGADARINLACSAAVEWCIRQGVEPEHAVCNVCNYLFPHCKVIGGHDQALQFIEINAKDFGIRKCTRVKVSGAFHTKLMLPAQEVFKEALRNTKISRPLIAIHSNIDGRPYKDEKDILKKLGKQMCSAVKWEQTLHHIYTRSEGTDYPMTFECGPGKTLLTILKMVNDKARKQARSISA